MDIWQAIEERHSIRKFQGTDISRENIERILMAGISAPSSKNRQPWQFTVVTSGAKEEMLAVMGRGIARERENPILPNSRQHLPGAEHTLQIMKAAPAVIMIENPLEKADDLPQNREELFYTLANAQSVGAAIENMSLAAVHLGLGSLWICDIDFAYPELCKWMGSGKCLLAALALGHADEKPGKRPRHPFADTVAWRE